MALILTALTAPVAPACNVSPTARTTKPRMNKMCDPSMRSPTRARTYGGVQTTAPMAPPTAVAVSLSRFERVVFIPMSRAGTAT